MTWCNFRGTHETHLLWLIVNSSLVWADIMSVQMSLIIQHPSFCVCVLAHLYPKEAFMGAALCPWPSLSCDSERNTWGGSLSPGHIEAEVNRVVFSAKSLRDNLTLSKSTMGRWSLCPPHTPGALYLEALPAPVLPLNEVRGVVNRCDLHRTVCTDRGRNACWNLRNHAVSQLWHDVCSS